MKLIFKYNCCVIFLLLISINFVYSGNIGIRKMSKKAKTWNKHKSKIITTNNHQELSLSSINQTETIVLTATTTPKTPITSSSSSSSSYTASLPHIVNNYHQHHSYYHRNFPAISSISENDKIRSSIENNHNHNRNLKTRDLVNEIDDTIYDDIESVKILISETFFDISASIAKLAGDASYTIMIFWEDTREFLNSAKSNMNNIINIIAAKILNVTDDAVRYLFEQIKLQLEKIKIIFDDLSEMADKEFENVLTNFNRTLITISEDMEEWSKNLKYKLRTIKNDDMYKEACEYIDEFINSSIQEMNECCNIAIRPVKHICEHIRKIIEHSIDLAVDIVDRIEKCVLDRRIPAHIMITCLNDSYDRFNDLIAEGVEIKHNFIDKLPLKIVISNFCISFATVSVEVRKNEITREVNKKYLKRNKLHTNT